MTPSARFGWRVLGLAVATAVSLSVLSAQQAPTRPGAGGPPLSTNGLIVGQVVDGSTGRGIAGALVTMTGGAAPGGLPGGVSAERVAVQFDCGLVSAETMNASMGGGNVQRVIADADGRFVFRELTRGTYTATVTMNGYSPGAFGRRRPEGPTRPIELADNERVTDATIRIWKFGVIAGTILDEAGEPVVGIGVRAYRRIFAGGRQRLGPGPIVQTDDRGIYRLASLVAGDYVVAVTSTAVTMPISSIDAYRASISSGSPSEMIRESQQSGAPLPTGNGLRVGDMQFQVTSSNSRAITVAPPATDGRLFIYPTQFFPGTSSTVQAGIITIGSGEERAAIDFNLRPTTSTRVSGVVTGPDGPAANLGVRLISADADALAVDSGFETATASTDAAGRFTFLGVPTGQYTLKAYRTTGGPQVTDVMTFDAVSVVGGMVSAPAMRPAAPASRPASPTLWAELPVSVGDSPVTGINLLLRTGLRVSGQVVFEGTAPRPPPQRIQTMTVTLGGVDTRLTVPVGTSRPDAEGRFATPAYPPGRYWLNASSPAPQWTIKSITVGGVNAIDQPVNLESNDLAGAVVTFTDAVSELSGTVQGASPGTEQDFVVMAFPAEYQSWIANGMPARRAAQTNTTKTGSFQMRVPVAGEYLVVALGAEIAVDQTPQFYASLARTATRVTIADGDKKSIAVTASRVR